MIVIAIAAGAIIGLSLGLSIGRRWGAHEATKENIVEWQRMCALLMLQEHRRTTP